MMVPAGTYLIALIGVLALLLFLDARYCLVAFYRPRLALKVVGFLVLTFIAWDAAGIALRIFFIGPGSALTGWRLAPEFPVEELAFLTLLSYLPLMLLRAKERWLA